MTQSTKLGYEIIKEAASWVTPEQICKEDPPGSNKGWCIDQIFDYYYGGDSNKSESYCAIFAWSVVDKAVRNLGGVNKLPKTAGARDMLERSRSVLNVDSQPFPGSVFYRKSAAVGATGHIGIVVALEDEKFHTVEGNTEFTLYGETYQGVWMMNYPYSSLGSRGFQFIHTERMIDDGLITYAFNPVPGENPTRTVIAGMSWPLVAVMSAVLIGGAYTMLKKRKT